MPKQAQARKIALVDPMIAPFDERADGGRGGVKNRDAVFFDDPPEAAFVGPVRSAFVHQDGGAGGKRAVDDVAVAGDPAAIGGTPEHIFGAMVEDPLEGFFGEQIVAGGGVLDAFGFAGRAAGVKDEQRRFAVERLGGAIGGGVFHQIVPPVIAAGLHVHIECRRGAARCSF